MTINHQVLAPGERIVLFDDYFPDDPSQDGFQGEAGFLPNNSPEVRLVITPEVSTPEPAALALVALMLACLACFGRRAALPAALKRHGHRPGREARRLTSPPA